MSEIAIINSGNANISSVYKAVKAVLPEPVVSSDYQTIKKARALIFPGIGTFQHTASQVKTNGLQDIIIEQLSEGKPFLGICLGMQLLLTESEESANKQSTVKGFNIIPGLVKLFDNTLTVPHVGWNKVKPACRHPLFNGLEEEIYFYFTHSYYAQASNDEHVLARTLYGHSFPSALTYKNIMGVQFHPEKSGKAGLRLFSNFGKIIADQDY